MTAASEAALFVRNSGDGEGDLGPDEMVALETGGDESAGRLSGATPPELAISRAQMSRPPRDLPIEASRAAGPGAAARAFSAAVRAAWS